MKWIVILLVVIVAGAVGSYWYEGYSAESKLLEQPVYRVLKKHEPAVFDKLVDEYKLFRREETRRENFINLANSEITLVATRNLAHASQDAVLALMQDMVATAHRLQQVPGDVCFRYWFPQVAGPPDIARYIDDAAQAHTLELMGDVIRTASESPSPLPSPEAVKDDPRQHHQCDLPRVWRGRADDCPCRRRAHRPHQGVCDHDLGVRTHPEPAACRWRRADARDDPDTLTSVLTVPGNRDNSSSCAALELSRFPGRAPNAATR